MAETEASAAEIALQIAANPGLKARFFEDPTATVADAVPADRPLGLGVGRDTKRLRRQVLAELSEIIGKTPEAESSSHAQTVMRQFFKGSHTKS